jgi:hypothetical protein
VGCTVFTPKGITAIKDKFKILQVEEDRAIDSWGEAGGRCDDLSGSRSGVVVATCTPGRGDDASCHALLRQAVPARLPVPLVTSWHLVNDRTHVVSGRNRGVSLHPGLAATPQLPLPATGLALPLALQQQQQQQQLHMSNSLVGESAQQLPDLGSSRASEYLSGEEVLEVALHRRGRGEGGALAATITVRLSKFLDSGPEGLEPYLKECLSRSLSDPLLFPELSSVAIQSEK